MRSSLFTTLAGLVGVYASAPEQLHIHFTGRPDAYVVSFLTLDGLNIGSSVVEFGASSSQLDRVATSTPYVFTDRYDQLRTIHDVELGGLIENERVYYRVGHSLGDEVMEWSEVYDFKVFDVSSDRPLKFSVFGDLARKSGAAITSIPLLVKDTIEEAHEFVLHIGDLGYNMDDNNGKVGDEFMRDIVPIAAHVPYMVGPGNHETDDNYSYRSYLAHFSGQGKIAEDCGSLTSRFYSWDSRHVHFVMIDTDAYIYPQVYHLKRPMYEFVKADLEKVDRSKTPWVVVMGHRAMYCTRFVRDVECDGWESLNVRNDLPLVGTYGMEQLLLEYKVDVFFSGHSHHYERTYPVANDVPVQFDYINPRAPVHIQSGIAGINGQDPFEAPPKDWDAFRDLDYNRGYGQVEVNATHFTFTQYEAVEKKVIDTVTIVKDQ